MNYILLFVALANPAYLGTYSSEQECKNAIRQIYVTRMVSPMIQLTPAVSGSIDTQLKIQQEFTCVPTKSKG